MKAWSIVALVALAMLGSTAYAVDKPDDAARLALAQKSGCLACHALDRKLVGPAYKDVAAKYKGNKKAEATLIAKVKKGGSGVWGAIPMPAYSPRVSDADIETMVKWVLAQ